MSFDSAIETAFKNTVSDPISRIREDIAVAENKRSTLVGGLMTEAVRIPLTNIGSITGWTCRSIVGLLGRTAGLAINAALLVPFAPGDMNLAGVRSQLGNLKRSIDLSAETGRPLAEVSGSLKNAAHGTPSDNLAQAA